MCSLTVCPLPYDHSAKRWGPAAQSLPGALWWVNLLLPQPHLHLILTCDQYQDAFFALTPHVQHLMLPDVFPRP